ncbi:MAG: MGMT family protein [Verrucomicrobiota bacterium]
MSSSASPDCANERRTLTVGVLTVETTFQSGCLTGVRLPTRVPARLTAEMLSELLSALEKYPIQFPAATPFTLRVWEAMRQIPFGGTVTYQQLAVRAGSGRGARAVGGACASNRLLLVVPCHRVVGSRDLGGFGPGLEWKRTLLNLEG